MKRRLCILLVALLLAPLAAFGETALLVISTERSVQGVMLMDEKDEVVSSTISQAENNDGIDWTLRVTDNGSQQATLYTRDANGNWLRTGRTYQMSSFFGYAAPTPQPAAAPEASWPQASYDGIPVSVYPLPEDERYQSRCGPSRSYHGAGAYKTYKISSIQALFIEDGYVLVDLDYTTVGRRRLYFQTKIFTGLGGVPQVTLSSYSAKTNCALTPRFGPSNVYNDFEEAAIGAGTSLSVFFEENGWVFAEFDCELGPVRAWIPTENVEAR
ncbi:MAG: hypothetical protein MRZ54_10515 [Clostridiales bacterium]|nr:hypothetical protein [Clostridiales bacterium]